MFDPDQLPVPDLGLSCPSCGYPVHGLTRHRCPECGAAFRLEDMIPPGDPPPLIVDGEPVRATPEVVELFSLYQVPAMPVQNEFDAALGVHAGSLLGPTRVALGVPAHSYLEALDLLRRLSHNEPLPDPPTPYAEGHDWSCAACGEDNPSNFGVCWSCEAPRDEAASATPEPL
ncbi:MAG: hypothetical protein AAGH99_09515 [Planctomycetota bacterium]